MGERGDRIGKDPSQDSNLGSPSNNTMALYIGALAHKAIGADAVV